MKIKINIIKIIDFIFIIKIIYYPNYVSGFGEITNTTPPSVKNSKVIYFYGFDITSEIIMEKSMMNVEFIQDIANSLYKLETSNALFFRVNFWDKHRKFESTLIKNFFSKPYVYKSIYGI